MHALNNAIGEPYLSPELMTQGCDVYLEESKFEKNPQQHTDHEIPDFGWYSEAVMATALRAHENKFSLDVDNPIHDDEESALRIHEPDTLGVVVNRFNVHWLTYKLYQGEIWLLDSMLVPQTVSFDSYRAALSTCAGAFALVQLQTMA